MNCFFRIINESLLFLRIVKLYFSEQFKKTVFSLIKNTIYGYSVIELKLNKLLKYININERFSVFYTTFVNYIDARSKSTPIYNILNNIFHKTTLPEIEFIRNGKVGHTATKKSLVLKLLDNSVMLENYDFIVYSDYTNKCVNKRIIQTKDLLQLDTDFKYTVSNVKFLLMELTLPENMFIKINLKTDQYNYYVVGNTIDSSFFKYFLSNHHNLNDADLTDSTVSIIDNNVNRIEYSCEKENVRIELDNYIKS